MAAGFHPPVEEYLEAIHGLSEEGVDVIQARLVERLGYSPQAVSEMVHRLSDDGFIVRSGRGVALSEKGRQRADSVVRKHRLAERFLVDILGLPWHKAHLEAGRWEHVISDEVEARFIDLLGHPTTCPHGNPIPGEDVSDEAQFAIADVHEGTTVTVARITEKIETNWDQLVYLSENGVIPGRSATVASKGANGSLLIELADGGATVELGADMTHELYVTAS